MDYRALMALSQQERKKILDLAAAINERNRLQRAEAEKALIERVASARQEVERLVESFKGVDPDLHRVVLFGSLARDNVKRLGFDIDLAVKSDRYMDLLGVALDSDFKVDLIDLEAASSYVIRSVEREGVEVYHAE